MPAVATPAPDEPRPSKPPRPVAPNAPAPRPVPAQRKNPPRPKKPPKKMVPRLPPGSKLVHIWTGTQWQAELTVLDAPTFRAFSHNQKQNMEDADSVYREWLSHQSGEVKARHKAHLPPDVSDEDLGVNK